MFFTSPDANKAPSSQSSDLAPSSSNLFGASNSIQSSNSVPASVSQQNIFGASASSQSLFSNPAQSSNTPSSLFSQTPTTFLSNTPGPNTLTPTNSATPAGLGTSSNLFSNPGSNFASNSIPSTIYADNTAAGSFSFSNNSNQGFGVSPGTNTSNSGLFSNTGFGGSSNTCGFGSSSGSSLFGTSTAASATPQNTNSGSSLFSANNSNSAPAQNTNSGSNLFSANNSNYAPAQNTNSSTSGGLFGTTNNNPTGFGATTPQQSLFSSRPPPQSAPAPATPLFANPAPGPYGNPFGGYNGQNLFSQSGHIPPFHETSNWMGRMPYNLTFSIQGLDTDLEIIVNDYDHYHVPSKVMVLASDFIKSLISSSNEPVDIETPFPNSLLEVLFWIVYSSESKLFDYISSFKLTLEVYSCIKLLGINNKKTYGQRLINHAKERGFFNNVQYFPEALSKTHVDFEFITEIIKYVGAGLFGGNQNLVKCAVLIEWLAERSCQSEQELKVLQDSQEFALVSKYIETNNIIPPTLGDYAIIVARYPVGSKVYNLQIALKGFGLLRV